MSERGTVKTATPTRPHLADGRALRWGGAKVGAGETAIKLRWRQERYDSALCRQMPNMRGYDQQLRPVHAAYDLARDRADDFDCAR